jgi:hypothetical protein
LPSLEHSPKGYEHENEKKLRQEILDNGKSRHSFPWITLDIELAGLKDPKFRPMDTANHSSKWFDKEHLELQVFDLRLIQPSTLDQI